MPSYHLLGLLVGVASGHHVLFFHNLGVRSHLIQLAPVMEELLERGHTVTAILFAVSGVRHDNFTEILLTTDMDAGMERFSQVHRSPPTLFHFTSDGDEKAKRDGLGAVEVAVHALHPRPP
jgi:hypothetical protein